MHVNRSWLDHEIRCWWLLTKPLCMMNEGVSLKPLALLLTSVLGSQFSLKGQVFSCSSKTLRLFVPTVNALQGCRMLIHKKGSNDWNAWLGKTGIWEAILDENECNVAPGGCFFLRSLFALHFLFSCFYTFSTGSPACIPFTLHFPHSVVLYVCFFSSLWHSGSHPGFCTPAQWIILRAEC